MVVCAKLGSGKRFEYAEPFRNSDGGEPSPRCVVEEGEACKVAGKMPDGKARFTREINTPVPLVAIV